jgi:hypothetical protein
MAGLPYLAMAFKVDVTKEAEIRAMVAGCAYGRHQPPREFKKSRAEVAAEPDAQVPSRKKMGTGWDVANAALFLASDEGQLHKRRFADRKLERRACRRQIFADPLLWNIAAIAPGKLRPSWPEHMATLTQSLKKT